MKDIKIIGIKNKVKGINNKNELTNVVEIIMDQFRREARV